MRFQINKCVLNFAPLCSGSDRLPPALLWAPTQPGGVHLPLRHWHVRPPVLHWEPSGQWRSSQLACFWKHRMSSRAFISLFPWSFRNWSSRKRPSSTSCQTSSTTAIKWCEWLLSRWGIIFLFIPWWLDWDSLSEKPAICSCRCTSGGLTSHMSWTVFSIGSWRTTRASWSSSSCCPAPTPTGKVHAGLPWCFCAVHPCFCRTHPLMAHWTEVMVSFF